MSEPKRFRKKPIVIEAMQMPLDNNHEAVRKVAEWMVTNGYDANPDGADIGLWGDEYLFTGPDEEVLPLPEYRGGFIEIETLEGVMDAFPGDWIIRGVAGEFYPCKPDIFAASYEPVEGHA